jgi:GAF domain-containing protein/DNA-binding CsgD family transcriptional regulator
VFDPDTLPVAVLVYDRSGRLTGANQPAVDLLGREAEIGVSAADADWTFTDAAGMPRPGARHPVLRAIESGEAQREIVARLRGTDGGDTWLQADATPVRSAAGEVEQVVVTLTDVTGVLDDLRLQKPTYGAAAIAAVTEAVAEADLDPREILDMAVAVLSKMRSGTWVATLMEKDPSSMIVVVANDSDPEVARYVAGMDMRSEDLPSTLSGRVFDTGAPVVMPAIDHLEHTAMLNPTLRDYIGSHEVPAAGRQVFGAVVVPMRARGSIVGTLGFFNSQESNPLTSRDVEWTQKIADRIGPAADNAQLYADAVNRLGRLTALRNAQLAISQSPDLRLTLEVILDQVIQGLAVDAADVLLVDSSGGELELAASRGFRSTSIPDYKLPVGEGMPAKAIAGRRIETVTGLGAFSQFRRRTLFAREGFRAYGAVPLLVGGGLVGVLEVFHRSALQPDREWFEFLDALGSDAAIAIERFALQNVAPATRVAGSPPPALSPLQKQILAYVVEGLPNAAIAEKVHLSPHTIKFHVGQMLERAGVHNRTELAHRATQEHWV